MDVELKDAVRDRLAELVALDGRLVLVLDDDPTGVQAVHGVPVLTRWEDEDLDWALAQPASTVFVLTNSRALSREAAVRRTSEIARRALRAAGRAGRGVAFVSRSDSTLRGHFPAETDALTSVLAEAGQPPDGIVLCPAFFEAGRLTRDDVHLARDGDTLVPVGETAFAGDATFGFCSSNLRDWVAETTGGQVRPDDVVSVRLADIRDGGPERVAAVLAGVAGGAVVIVNAEDYDDLTVFVTGLLLAERAGKRFVYRTGPSFPRVRGAITPPAPLDAEALFGTRRTDRAHGLVLVGSHVPLTTAQLELATMMPGVAMVELNVPLLLDERERSDEVARVVAAARAALADADVIVYTSRTVVAGVDRRSALDVGEVVSGALVSVADGIDASRLDWLIAKGGITSSDIGTQALGVRRAVVAGPLLEPGIVPVWILPDHSAAPGLPFVIFPGNVGGPHALADAIATLRQGR